MKAFARDSYKANPKKKKASACDSYMVDPESKRSAKRRRYEEDLEENRAAKRRRYQEDLEENRSAKRRRYEEDLEGNRAAKRQKYNSAAIKASERSRYWNDPAVRLAKRAAERTRYRRGQRTTTIPPKGMLWHVVLTLKSCACSIVGRCLVGLVTLLPDQTR